MNAITHPRAFLRALLDRAIAAAHPQTCLPPHLPPAPLEGHLTVLGAGKAAAAMAETVEAHYSDLIEAGRLSGLVITRHGHGPISSLRAVECVEAGHPMPDQAGLDAAHRLLTLAKGLGADDPALVLLSGGGSSLMTLPVSPVPLDDLQAVSRALLRSGAPISDINTVRKHLSQVTGGGLAAALYPAPSLTLAISDVPNDDPETIASGPTVKPSTTPSDALSVLSKWHIGVPETIQKALAGAAQPPKADLFAPARYRLIANGTTALAAAAEAAKQQGVTTDLLGDAIEGEARQVAQIHADLARQATVQAAQDGTPRLILSGGELTVAFSGENNTGKGGPNQEYALALAIALDGAPNIYALAADTDGVDGGTGSADDPSGAMVSPDTLARAAAKKIDSQSALIRHDAGGFFAALGDSGDLLTLGPTRTNVNDFRAILVLPPTPT